MRLALFLVSSCFFASQGVASVVVFNEVMYHPKPGPNSLGEWVELQNQYAVAVDISGWSITGGTDFVFPAGTIIDPEGYVLVVENPALWPNPASSPIYGPLSRKLSNNGDRLELRDVSGRLIDTLNYGTVSPWPIGPDGAGVSLARKSIHLTTDSPDSWEASRQIGGSPGQENFPAYRGREVRPVLTESSTWKFASSPAVSDLSWLRESFDDASWASGSGLFAEAGSIFSIGRPETTVIDPAPTTRYFRTKFELAGNPQLSSLVVTSRVDDGAVFFLNGIEVGRWNMPTGGVTSATAAASGVIHASPVTLTFPRGTLRSGTNVLGVEVHQGPILPSYPNAVTQSKPVMYWRFGDGAESIQDSSAMLGSQSGVATGLSSANLKQLGVRPLDTVLGKNLRGFESSNASLRFAGNTDNGDDVVVTPYSAALDFGGQQPFSLELWVHGPIVQEEGAGLVARGVGGGGEQFALDVFGGKYRFFTRDALDPSQAAVATAAVGPANGWQHLVAVHDPSNGVMSVYVNGVLSGSAPALQDLPASNSEISVGSRPGVDGQYTLNFTGRMDELAVYRHALSPVEVAAHFNAAFETYSATSIDVSDVTFQLQGQVEELIPALAVPRIRFNESRFLTGEPPAFELLNLDKNPASLSGWTIEVVHSGDRSDSFALATSSVPGGGRIVVEKEFVTPLFAGDRLFLWSSNKLQLVDSLVIEAGRRTRWPEGMGSWSNARTSTLGTANTPSAQASVILSEIMYHPRGLPAKPDVFGSAVEVVKFTNQWLFRGDGLDLGTDWRDGSNVDAKWGVSRAPFVWPSNVVYSGPKNTLLPTTNSSGARLVTHYFKTSFQIPGTVQDPFLRLTPLADDGAVVYLNGNEVARFNMPLGETINARTLAASNVGNPSLGNTQTVTAPGLVAGENWIAVEVHQSSTNVQDLAFALQVEVVPRLEPAVPYRDSNNSWIELQNVSSVPVSLSGWSLDDGVNYSFPSNTVIPAGGFLLVAQDPAFLTSLAPPCPVVGPFQGRLSHGSDSVVLRDASGNIVHAVHYFGGGRWPDLADGAGSSLELRDANADPSVPESWAPSIESDKVTSWQTFRWRGLGVPGQLGEPDVWKELALALLDGPGEIWVDDVSVIENPATAPRELIVNGTFESSSLARWRFLGTHRHSEVIEDPTRPGNHILRLVANGAGEYQGNQIESTLTNNLALSAQKEYEISYRALWRSGGRKLNARLYFNRLARTFDLQVPEVGGTPGRTNSTAVPNLGPGIFSIKHSPTIPVAFQPIQVTADLSDPDGVQGATVHFRAGTSPWQLIAMQRQESRDSKETWTAEIPGALAGTLLQFYVEAIDTQGVVALFPTRGPDSRALIRIEDGQADPGYRHHVRVLMTDADAQFLHTGTNTLSNELLPCTVIDNESDVYYDVGVRLKGSFVGRNVARVGFHLGFHEDQPYRGRHRTLSVDRSQHAATGGIGEVVAKHIANAAGGVPSSYDDVAFLIAPIKSYNIVAQLRMSALDSEYLDGWWDRGSDGSVFEVEVHRWNLATVDGKPESLKVVGNESGGTGYTDLELLDWGSNSEVYRWNHLLTNRRDVDDYSGPVRMCQLFGLPQASFNGRADSVLDVEQWLRVLAYQILVGPGDAVYTGGAVHNFRYYVRPGDDRILYVPWDWDSSWQKGPTDTLFGGGNMAKLVTTPDFRRRYLNQVHDLVTSVFNRAYMSSWITHYGEVGNQDLRYILDYIDARAKYVLTQLPLNTPFSITNRQDTISTNADGLYVLGGTAPIALHEIQVNGVAQTIRWVNNTNWQVVLQLTSGTNVIQVQGYGLRGDVLTNAVASTQVISTSGLNLQPVAINEWMASNQAPGGIPDPADGLFQDWFELYNPNAVSVNLGGYYLTDTLAVPQKWRIPDGVVLRAHSYLIIWADNSPEQTTLQVPAGEPPRLHASFALSDAGESIALIAPDGKGVVSKVDFGPQIINISQGSYPDGAIVSQGGPWFQMRPTPGAPNEAETSPRILETSLSYDASGKPLLTLIFASQPGSTYQVESQSALGNDFWLAQGGSVVVNQVKTAVTIPVTQNAAFFRIRR